MPHPHRPPRRSCSSATPPPDLDRAAALHARLVAEGRKVWFDKARLTPGCDWHKDIEAGCDAARIILPLLTPRWAMSEWTRYETYAHDAVIPVLAEGKAEDVMPPPLRRWNAVALDPLAADEPAWQALLAAIRARLAQPVTEPPPTLRQLPHDPNRWFIGREVEMNRLHEALHPAPSPNPDSLAWAITGLGGRGKTTLANEYARRFARLYRLIFWIYRDRDYQPQFAALHDDVSDRPAPAGMSDAWIPRHGPCRTVITARIRQFPGAIRGIELEDLAPEAARAFLCLRTSRAAEGAESAACDRLVERLGGLPLALEQAAAYIEEQRLGFAKYLREYEAETARLLAEPVPGFTHYPDSVVATWQVTLKQLSPEARAVLRLCSALGSAPIALPMFVDGAQAVAVLGDTLPELRPRRSWLPWRGRRDTAPVRLPRAPDRKAAQQAVRDAVVKGLHRYAMIQDWNGESFRVHRLVRDVEWLAMDKAAQRYACGLLGRMLETHAPTDPRDAAEREACDAALVHGAAFGDRLKQAGLHWPDETLPGVLYECATARGAVAAAEAYAFQHYEEATRHRGPIHDVTRRAAERVARSLYDRGEYAQALPILQVILHGHEVRDGPEHPATLTSLNNLAGCMQALGDAAGALPLYQRALDGRERVLGKEHPDTLTSVNNLAECLDTLGRSVEAEALHRRALEGLIGRLGPEHPDVLTSQNNLAHSLRKAGHPDLAEPYARQCADASARVLGEAHPLALHRRNNLAITLLMLCRTAEARSLLAVNWAAPCPHSTPVTQAIAFRAAAAALLEGTDATDPLGRLKTLLLGPKLQQAPGVGYPWDAGYLLDHLRDALPPDSFAFLQAALAAINDPAQASDLDRFPLWRDTPAVPLDTSWPSVSG